MTRGRRSSVRELQASTRSVTPEPATEAGTTPGNALYDAPPQDSAPAELGTRSRKKTQKIEYYENGRSRSHSRSEKWTRTHSRNLRARSNSRANNNDVDDLTSASTVLPSTQDGTTDAQPNPERPQPRSRARIVEPSTQTGGRRGRKSRNARRGIRSRSPTPASTDDELEVPPLATGETPAGSQHTYIYESVPHDVFMQYARNRLGADADLKDRPTADILEMLRVKEADQAVKMGSARHKTSIIMLSPEPIAVGGGWHRERIPSEVSPSVVTLQGGGPRPAKRGADEPAASNGSSSKRQRAIPQPVLADNTDTEPESDDYVMVPTSPTPAGPILSPAQRAALSQSHLFAVPRPSLPPLRGTQAPPPSREPTASTLLDSPQPSAQPSRSHSLGGSLPLSTDTTLPILPRLDYPPRDPTHARLRASVLADAVDRLNKIVGDEEDEEDEESAETDGDDAGDVPSPIRPRPSARKATTYQGGQRSHLRSNPGPRRAVASASSKSAARDSLLAMERAQAASEQVGIVLRRTRRKEGMPYHSPSSTQAQPGSSASASGPSGNQSRRNNPVSAARADMLAYNQELVEGRTRSTVQDAIRHNRLQVDEEMRVRSGPTRKRSLNGLVDDDEETHAHAEALAAGTFPKPTRTRRRRNQKKKPLARNSTGLARQVLVVAKIYLFGYALQEGIYQTRATFLNWAQLLHYDTWSLLLTKVAYIAATDSELEVMVNYLATLRGKVKERLRPIVAEVHGFKHRIAGEQDIQDNLDQYNLVYPNTFHCREYSPRKGHYESPHLARFIAAGLFHGPTSVGMQFPEFFEEMLLTVVAFILALWQFGLEEWSPGFFQPKELGASYMLDKYEAHLAGLKTLRDVAPRRMSKLQQEWRKYTKEYLGAAIIPKQPTQDVTPRSELRPDSPAPQFENVYDFEPGLESRQLSEEEEDARLMQHARLESLKQASRDNDRFFAAHADLLAAADNSSRSPSRSPTPPLPVEYNDEGCLTAAAKGKHRSN
ncbi:hypothetical protein BDV93DRAFT_564336 [Ceratobasidium sp. AG-I]|nr:hypothetical protein BDV93DRAFT_564336 [Ceratobasidium sp. AG-I]